jgi:hypothetical protein
VKKILGYWISALVIEFIYFPLTWVVTFVLMYYIAPWLFDTPLQTIFDYATLGSVLIASGVIVLSVPIAIFFGRFLVKHNFIPAHFILRWLPILAALIIPYSFFCYQLFSPSSDYDPIIHLISLMIIPSLLTIITYAFSFALACRKRQLQLDYQGRIWLLLIGVIIILGTGYAYNHKVTNTLTDPYHGLRVSSEISLYSYQPWNGGQASLPLTNAPPSKSPPIIPS